MGIQSLLPLLANSTRDAHISEFENEFVAIDGYCWLHKAIYCCAYELAMKKPTVKYVTYCMRYIEMLLHFNVKPILVFDGRSLPSKSETERKRRLQRQSKFERGKILMEAGRTLEGRKLLGESVDVTHELALNLIKECRKKNIDCIVAPFEADAQLFFLSLQNIVKCIITEDSDLLVYGAERVMFKMDTCGRGKLIEKSEIYKSLKMDPEDFSEDIFRYMCILCGCDYLPSLPSIGPVNALKFVKMLRGNDIYDILPKLPIYLNKLNITVTPEYREGFRIADNTFKHQLVYNPFLRSQVPLRPVKNEDDIVGTKLPDEVAFKLAVGNIDPITMKEVDDYDPDKTGRGFSILWKRRKSSKVPEARRRRRENPESDTVQPVTNDLKKQRTLKMSTVKKSGTQNCFKKVPECGFIFDPKFAVEKKNVSDIPDETKLERSRYFAWAKNFLRRKKPTVDNSIIERRKNESQEEYFERLFNEYFPESESEDSETKKDNIGSVTELKNKVLERCPLCRKDRTCSCLDINVLDSQTLGELSTDGEEFKERKENFGIQHSLFEEIDRIQKEESERARLLRESEKAERESSWAHQWIYDIFRSQPEESEGRLLKDREEVEEGKENSLAHPCWLDEILKNQMEKLEGELLLKDDEEVEEGKNSRAQHFLLDQIYKIQMEKSERGRLVKEDEKKLEEAEKTRKEFPSENLGLNFSKTLPNVTETRTSILETENSKTVGAVGKENSKVIIEESEESGSDRSPSPVFRIQREAKVLNRNCRLDNISDTAGTLTSVYFSPISSGVLNVSNPQVSSGRTPAHRKIPSLKGSNSVPSKTGRNKASLNKTLFQFGFKKQRRDENNSET